MAEDDHDTQQILTDIREFFTSRFGIDLTDDQVLECHLSLISLGHAIAKWREQSHDKLSNSN